MKWWWFVTLLVIKGKPFINALKKAKEKQLKSKKKELGFIGKNLPFYSWRRENNLRPHL